MNKNRKKAFTLIELIAVLVILAFIVLIVMPLVMNIVKKSKQSANERSIDAYGKALEISVATYLLDEKGYPSSLEGLKVEYTGSEVNCLIKTLNEDGSIYLSECSVAGIEVKDSKEEDGYYHYGHKLTETSKEYKEYQVGDKITYKGINFYVIAPSDKNLDYVTLLKAEPLTVDEVNKYGVGHINRYTKKSIGITHNSNGYGGVAYYTSETCGIVNASLVNTVCKTGYNESEIKYIVDAWSNDKLNTSDLKEDSLGYKTRLLTIEDLKNKLGYTEDVSGYIRFNSEKTPSWVYNSSYRYWTMSAYADSEYMVSFVNYDGSIGYGGVFGNSEVIRPVINLLKFAI